MHRSPQSTPCPRTVPEPPPALRTPKRTTTAGGMSSGKSAVPNLSDVQRRWLATTSHRLADTGALHRYGFHSPPDAAVRATRVKSGYSPRHSGGPTGGAASSHRSGDGGSLAIGGIQRAAGEADADDLRVEERHERLAVTVDRQRAGGDRRTPEVAPPAERAGEGSRRRRTHRSRERDDGARRVAEHASAGALIEAAAAVLDPDAGTRVASDDRWCRRRIRGDRSGAIGHENELGFTRLRRRRCGEGRRCSGDGDQHDAPESSDGRREGVCPITSRRLQAAVGTGSIVSPRADRHLPMETLHRLCAECCEAPTSSV